MLARNAPTYSYEDLVYALHSSAKDSARNQLCSRIRALYGVSNVFLLESAREALRLLLMAYNRPGGVLMSAYTCIVVPQAVYRAGYYPVFADINRRTLNVSIDTIRESSSERVTVALATHLFGIPCSVADFKNVFGNKDVLMVEDAAPALGAEFEGQILGQRSDATILSFHSTKVISGEGGGALLTNDDGLAGKIRLVLETSGTNQTAGMPAVRALARKTLSLRRIYPITHLGYRMLKHEKMFEVAPSDGKRARTSFRLCPDTSALLVLRQLDRLSSNLKRRQSLARIYQKELSNRCDLTLIEPLPASAPAWIQYPVWAENKWGFYKHMQSRGIDLSWSYRYSCPESYGLRNFPNSHQAAESVVGLPTYPSLTEDQARQICQAARCWRS